MAILWCGAEDIDFPTSGSLSVVTTSTHFRSGYGRCALQMPQFGSTVAQSNTFAGGSITSGWVSGRIYHVNSSLAGSVTKKLFGFGKSATSAGIAIAYVVDTGKIHIVKTSDGSIAGDTSLASESGFSITGATNIKLDLQIASFGASGTATVYVNGQQVVTYTGDLTAGGITNLDRVFLFSKGVGGGSADSLVSLSEFIVADEDTRTMSLVTLAPNAAGDANTFDSGAYTDVDETTINDSDLLSSATSAQAVQVNLTNLPSGSFSAKAVKVVARASRGVTGIQQLRLGVRSGGTTNIDAGRVLTTNFDSYERLMTTNPVTSAAWTLSDIDAVQMAMESLT